MTMEETKYSRRLCLLFLPFFGLVLLLISGSADAYKNYTVGGSFGWHDSTENSKVNYQKWADGKNFSLGDFLSKLYIF
uniref:Phytocyanin domain-containing protein n=1 Tax=Rhizophora mucronata TaxID=61149 RepID=A0A2P2JUN5_RHIMU